MSIINKLTQINNADLGKLSSRLDALRKKMAIKLPASQTVASSTSPDDLIDALTTAQKRAK